MDLFEFYNKRIADKTLKTSRRDLENIYADIPETKGCMENLGTCGAWCCEHQNPSVLYVEFMNTFWHINHHWPKERIAKLFMKAVRTYVEGKPTKGCVFWDSDTKQCQQHETRPFDCRTYGQIPEEFKPRYEALKVLYEGKPGAVVKDQCGLVQPENGKKITPQELNTLFEQLKLAEQDIGIPSYLITDGHGGSYRTYHDHILLQMAPADFLTKLTAIRNSTDEDAKKSFLDMLEKTVADDIK